MQAQETEFAMAQQLDQGPGASANCGPNSELAFAQWKLEENYGKVYQRLGQWRGVLEAGQEVLVWRRPVPAVLLYVCVHWLFYYFATNNESPLSQLSTLLFWLLVADAVWRAATRDSQELEPNNSRSNAGAARRGRRREVAGVLSFERALLLTHEQRNPHQLVPYEVVCLTLAGWWMWLDNLWLALRHWSIHDPMMFCMSLAVPGLVLAVVGKYIPTIALFYILVMGAIVWPYIQYHDVLQKSIDLFTAHFPVFIQKVKVCCQFFKTLLSRDETALNEFSLARGGDEIQTQDMLGGEFERAVTNGGEGREGVEGEEEGRRGRGAGRGGVVRRHGAVRRVDPGMSVLQDSVLGLSADAFHHEVEDSLASFGPGSGDFPSISNLDQSLTLPQFPPEGGGYHSATPTAPDLATIQESEEVFLDDVNPLEYSAELEFGLDMPDGQSGLRHRSTSQQQPRQQMMAHPLVQYSASAPTSNYPHAIGGELLIGHITPPPPYDAVVPQGGLENPGAYGSEYQHVYPKFEEDLSRQQSMPKDSSTPLFDGRQ